MPKSPDEIRQDLERRERQRSAVAKPADNGAQAAHTPRQKAQRASAWSGERPTRSRASTGVSQDIHRTPPHSVEAEQGVIGSMLLSPRDTIAEVVAQVNENYFYVPAHVTIYNALVKMWDSSQAIDMITLTEYLRNVGQLEAVGGPAFLAHVQTFVPTAANVLYYVGIVIDKFLLRQMIAGATETVRRAYEEQDEVRLLLDDVEQRFISIGDTVTSVSVTSMKDNVMHAIEVIESAHERKGITGLSTGFVEFDRMTNGLQPSEMIVIAGRPSMGKTGLCMNIVEHVALVNKTAVGVFSLEMSTNQLTQRLLCSRARVNSQKVRDGFLSERDFPALTAAASKFGEAPIYIDDSSSMSILELRAKARRLKSRYDIGLVVVDYLQLLSSMSKRGQENRQVEVSEISKGLKSLAKELKLPVLVAAQLNRQPEGRYHGKPRLSDLRESGSIEQDSDTVCLLTRPEVYEDDQELRHEMAGEAELIIAKQRNGPTGEVYLTFIKEFTRFETRARNIGIEEEF